MSYNNDYGEESEKRRGEEEERRGEESEKNEGGNVVLPYLCNAVHLLKKVC